MINEEVLYEEVGNGRVGLYFEENIGWVMTCDLDDWSVEEYKRYLRIWGAILNDINNRGIFEVFGLCEDDKAVKFNEIFGFVFTGGYVNMVDGTVRKVMRLEP